jgi:hypothetical protein
LEIDRRTLGWQLTPESDVLVACFSEQLLFLNYPGAYARRLPLRG